MAFTKRDDLPIQVMDLPYNLWAKATILVFHTFGISLIIQHFIILKIPHYLLILD
ncbi:hypothetical protein L0P88_12695 [Muricauda sp. SCSIO 64092]|uniref:hypothetical protein n=1 Tax=Allomuricauda sp. SCSIO 64092 TaxID=2908842 RepID=UPI001FF6ABCA|nr:hypothetical protein [Muricauda sp. SCSIO 64092]UOY04815.1 hypothetical protein L0P88_12695 [Muricauda sp. SCSIO 64092]